MSPSRWEQEIPAACMNVARPSSCATSASQVARSRLVSRAGQPAPAGQRASQRVGDVAPLGLGAAGQEVTAGERGGFQQRGVVAGQHGHGPRRTAAHPDDHAARALQNVGAAGVAQVGADQSRPGAQADQRRCARPPGRRRLGVGQREVAGDLARRVRLLGPLAGQRRISGVQVRHHLAGDEPQVGAQRPPRRPGDPRRVRGEPLDHRRVQQHPGHRLHAQPDRPAGELARRPQQALRPVPAPGRGSGDHLPGELRGRRRGARSGLPPGHVGGHLTRNHTVFIL